MNNSLKKQKGMTPTSILMLLIGICSVVMLILKISPVYMNHGKVKSALEGIKNTTDIQTASKGEILKKLYDRFDINQVNRQGIDEKENILLTKQGDYVKLQIKYQVEVPIISNISALMKFDDFIEAGSNKE
jgi:hypothetical protein